MNSYMDAQCKNILALVQTFEQSCDLAALKDDGQISPDEEKSLKKIHAASKKFRNEIEKLK